jgi:hypothetical protein
MFRQKDKISETHYLQLDSLAIELNCADLEVNTNRCNEGWCPGVVTEAQQETRLSNTYGSRVSVAYGILVPGSHTRVSNEQKLRYKENTHHVSGSMPLYGEIGHALIRKS